MLGNENKNTIITEKKDAPKPPSPPPIPPQLERPSALWKFIVNSYPTHLKDNRDDQIGKPINWTLVLKGQQGDGKNLSLTLQEDNIESDTNAFLVVTCLIPISNINASTYEKLKSLSINGKHFVEFAGKIKKIPMPEEVQGSGPTIEVSQVKIIDIRDTQVRMFY